MLGRFVGCQRSVLPRLAPSTVLSCEAEWGAEPHSTATPGSAPPKASVICLPVRHLCLFAGTFVTLLERLKIGLDFIESIQNLIQGLSDVVITGCTRFGFAGCTRFGFTGC
jgi:hypothetical protein